MHSEVQFEVVRSFQTTVVPVVELAEDKYLNGNMSVTFSGKHRGLHPSRSTHHIASFLHGDFEVRVMIIDTPGHLQAEPLLSDTPPFVEQSRPIEMLVVVQ